MLERMPLIVITGATGYVGGRLLIPVPVLTAWLSSRWLGLVTPLYARIGRKLIHSVRHPTTMIRGIATASIRDLPPAPT
jgi:uncharacterized membrane protein YjjB (DUF3815 family)